MEKRITCRLNNQDCINIDSIKALILTSSDSEAIRYSLSVACQTPNKGQTEKDETTSSIPKKPKVRKFTDDYIDAMLEKTSYDKGFCPMHPELTISECACFKSDNRKILLKEWLENQYE